MDTNLKMAGRQLFATLPVSHATNMEELERQININLEQWQEAAEFLLQNDLAALPPGRHEITGNGVYASVQEYDTKDNAPFENHRRYIDIQCIVSGHEEIFISSISDCYDRISEYDAPSDIEFFGSSSDVRKVRICGTSCIILFPGEAHKPCISPDGRKSHIMKIVIKVPYKE